MSIPYQRIDQRHPETKLREVPALAGKDQEYPLVLMIRYLEGLVTGLATDTYKLFVFGCGLQIKEDGITKRVDGIIKYLGMTSQNTFTDYDDDGYDQILDAEMKVMVALRDYLQKKMGGTEIRGEIRCTHRGGYGGSYRYTIETGIEPIRKEITEQPRALNIPFPGLIENLMMLEAICEEANHKVK